MGKSILYVCTYWGVRSNIAKLLTDAMEIPGLEVESSGFETGVIGKLPQTLMAKRGLALSDISPGSVFAVARKKRKFDYVVSLCNRNTQENCDLLISTVSALFEGKTNLLTWNIPDFMSISSEGEEKMVAAEGIVQLMESNIEGLVEEIQRKKDSTPISRTGS